MIAFDKSGLFTMRFVTSLASLFVLATTAMSAAVALTSQKHPALVQRSLSGQATYYGGNEAGGACSFSTYALPAKLFGTALSSSNWDVSANCGGCVAVHYGGKSITAMV